MSYEVFNNNCIEENLINNYVHKKFRKRKRESTENITIPAPSTIAAGESSINHNNNDTTINDLNLISDPVANDVKSMDNDRNTMMNSLPLPVVKKMKLDTQANNILQPSLPFITKNLHQLSNIYQYHTNMIRKHPTKDRSEEEQLRRDKNTIACWISRRKKKLKDLMIIENYESGLQKYDQIVRETLRTAHYVEYLLKAIQTKSNSN